MKNLLAIAAIVAGLALALAALPAVAGPAVNGCTAQTGASTTQPSPYPNTGSASAALQGYTTSGPARNSCTAQTGPSTTQPSPYANTGSASAALQGYTTSGPATTQLTTLASGGNAFDWGDAGIGAAVATGTALIVIGLSLVALRRRGRLAV